MRRLLLVLAFGTIVKGADAGAIKYPASAIPAALLKNANVVKRADDYTLRINGTDELILTHKYALTILNENGDDAAQFAEGYDKFYKIRSIDGTLYDASGNELKKLKQKDIADQSAVSDISLIDDNRVKSYQFYYKSYPYTVEYEVEISIGMSLNYPSWVPQDEEHLSVEQSSYTIICNQDDSVRFHAFNYKNAPAVSSDKGKKVMRWEVKDLPAIERPFASPIWPELTTAIYFAPTRFEVQGYKGDMSSWKDLGKFQYALDANRDQIPPQLQQTVNQLVSGITDEREKVRVLYEYLQKNTRYISIQLGIGGWQPFEAAFVAQKGYGDCKALSNYMYSLLKAAGIRSNVALIYAGNGQEQHVFEDFPSAHFNHMIVCVPMQKDSMWLECTDQHVPAGYMGAFTGNRKALIIDEQGGTLVSTPRYGVNDNLLKRNIQGKIDADGNLQMKVDALYTGTQQDDLSMMINSLSKEKVKKILQQEMELSTYDVTDFKYDLKRSTLPQLTEQLGITVDAYATVSGKRLFITPNILNRGGRKLDADPGRTADLVFTSAWRDEDDYVIEIPEGYHVEAAPRTVSLSTEFGTYTSSARLDGNKIVYHRVRQQFAGRFPAKDLSTLITFYESIAQADKDRMVLVKGE